MHDFFLLLLVLTILPIALYLFAITVAKVVVSSKHIELFEVNKREGK